MWLFYGFFGYYKKQQKSWGPNGGHKVLFIWGLESVWGLYVGHRGRLYKVWEVYGDPMGVIVGRLCEDWEVYGDPMGVIRGCLYEVWKVYGDPMGVIGVVYVRFGKCMGTLWGS